MNRNTSNRSTARTAAGAVLKRKRFATAVLKRTRFATAALKRRGLATLALAAAATLALAACAPAASGPDTNPSGTGTAQADTIQIVTSTDVYGDIASTIGGTSVHVTSIITSPNQDPHEFQADARSQLALSKAQVVIENGGGYDDFIDTMLSALGNKAQLATGGLLNVADISGYDQNPAGQFNEHLWYDLPTMQKLAHTLAAKLTEIDPGHAATFTANAEHFDESLTNLEHDVAQLAAHHKGDGVLVTEPLPLYMTDAAGLVDKTDPKFLEAMEEGTDVAPTVLRDTIALLTPASVRVVVDNPQTSNAQSDAVLKAAKENGIPVVPMTETLPAQTHYVTWMHTNIEALGAALAKGGA